jgi:hypothetical protein
MRITDMGVATITGGHPIAPLTFATRPRIRNLVTVSQIDGPSPTFQPSSDEPYQPGTLRARKLGARAWLARHHHDCVGSRGGNRAASRRAIANRGAPERLPRSYASPASAQHQEAGIATPAPTALIPVPRIGALSLQSSRVHIRRISAVDATSIWMLKRSA